MKNQTNHIFPIQKSNKIKRFIKCIDDFKYKKSALWIFICNNFENGDVFRVKIFTEKKI